MSDIHERARGRWRDILLALAVTSAKELNGKHGPCPFCAGKDRFRYEDHQGSGSWICTHCTSDRGRESGMSFVMKAKGVNFLEAKRLVETVIGEAKVAAPKATSLSEEERRAMLKRMWRSGKLLDGHDIASRYLAGRRISPSQWPAELRWHGSLFFDKGQSMPAMIARFSDPTNTHATIHRTWLEEPGVKAKGIARKMMPGKIPHGGSVRLGPAAATMGIAEGLETALSASIIFGITVWAATSTSFLKLWQPPPEAKTIIIFADGDENYAGQYSAYALAYKLKTENINVTVEIPKLGQDWNDVLKERA